MAKAAADSEVAISPETSATATPFDPAAVYAALEAMCRKHDPKLDFIRVVFGQEGEPVNRLNVPIVRQQKFRVTLSMKRIIAALRKSPCPLSRTQLSMAMGRGKDVAGQFSTDIKALVENEELFEDDSGHRLLTDDPSKFADGS